MLNKINEIEVALNTQCYHCALALTLTLPDICAKVLYSEQSGKKHYIEWFDKYVVPVYSPLEKNRSCFITGEVCYSLRCSFLHAGNFEVEKHYFNIHKKEKSKLQKCNEVKNIYFNIHTREKSEQQGYHDLRKEVNGQTIIDIDAVSLCNAVCEAAKTFYNDTENKDLFRDKYISDVS